MDGEVFFYAIVGLFFGAIIFIRGLLWFRQKQMIENTPTSKIRSLAMGLVEIFGQVMPFEKKILKSPFSGKECVYYKYAIEEHRKGGKGRMWTNIMMGENPQVFSPGGGGWVPIKTDEGRTVFYLKDNTGKVLVDPKGAKIEITADFEYNSGFGKDPPANVIEFLQKNGISHEGFFGMNKEMRFREYIIEPGNKLYIMGTAGDNPYVEEGSATEHVDDVMIHKGENEKLYFISDSQEKDIVSKLRWKSRAGVFGGVALIAGCLVIIFLYTGF